MSIKRRIKRLEQRKRAEPLQSVVIGPNDDAPAMLADVERRRQAGENLLILRLTRSKLPA